MIKRLLPIAKVYIKVKGQTYMLDSGVSDNLPVPVVLGRRDSSLGLVAVSTIM